MPSDVLKRVVDYLDSAQIDEGRRYGYMSSQPATNALCAEGLLCRQYLGWSQSDPRLIEGVSDLVKKAGIAYDSGENHDVYCWYYLTQAAHHMEGKIWTEWNNSMRDIVPKNQVSKGPEAGSWDPTGDKWASWNGRLYMTCLSIYMLEVYYRHLPIYSGYRAIVGIDAAMPPATEPSSDEATAPRSPQTRRRSPTARRHSRQRPKTVAPETPVESQGRGHRRSLVLCHSLIFGSDVP